MKKGKHLFRGLSAALAVLMLICMSLTTLTLGNTTWINSNLNIQDTKTIGGSDEFAVYWANDYGYDSTALIEVYYDAADANVEIAQEGMTLLKNDNAALPLADGTRFTIFGNAAVNSNIYRNSCPDYIPYVDFVSAMQTQFGADNVNTVLCDEVYPELGSTGTNSVAEADIAAVAAHESTWQSDYNDAAVVVISRNGSEGNDVYQYASDDTYPDGSPRRMLDLSTNEEALISYLADQKAAGVFDKIVVVLSSEFQMELGFLEEYGVDACLLTGMTGSYGCTAIADVLAGEVNPSGKTVNTYASSSISAPSVVNGGVGGCYDLGNADELNAYDQINGDENIDYYIIYSEGIYVGYKYYETRYEDTVMGTGSADGTAGTFNSANGWNYAEEVCYPFGYGLSYTTFEQTLDSVTYDEAEDTDTVAVTVTNTGDVAGKTWSRCTPRPPTATTSGRPGGEVRHPAGRATARPTCSSPASARPWRFPSCATSCASYDTDGAGTYILSAGDYYLSIGSDAHDALNNVLAAKGYTTADGMTADGDTAKTYTWNQEALDAETYSASIYTGAEVGNVFDDADQVLSTNHCQLTLTLAIRN